MSVNSGTSSTLTFDANGNMLSDGTNSYSWDAEDRLIQVTYPGTGNNSQFSYDSTGRLVEIQESAGGSITATGQFIGGEERNASGSIVRQFFSLGEIISGTNYFHTSDHLCSVAEITNSSGSIQGQYAYDPFGQVVNISQITPSDFQYAGYYFHNRSGLDISLNRAYSAHLSRAVP